MVMARKTVVPDDSPAAFGDIAASREKTGLAKIMLNDYPPQGPPNRPDNP